MKVQATIIGFTGTPCTVLATIADGGGAIYVAKIIDYKAERVLDSVLIANTDLDSVEFQFTEADLGDAIAAFQQSKNGGMISFASVAQLADPSGAIEQDGITESGRKMRIAAEIKNQQVATLAICLYSMRAKTNSNVMSMMDELLTLQSGGVLSF